VKLWRRVKSIVVEKILGVHDTPQRIAWGVAIGFFVACTPTMGLQFPIYVTCAVLLRANKVSGIVPTWLVNPVTMVPFYWACWRVGALLLGTHDTQQGRERIDAITRFSWAEIGQAGFWRELGLALWSLGAELWLGGVVVGLVLGAIAYPITLHAVRAYRRSKHPAAPGPVAEPGGADDSVGISESAQP
jgi:uncharacterized protein (DUF2062 family)